MEVRKLFLCFFFLVGLLSDFEESPTPANNSDVLRFLTRMVIEKQKEQEEKEEEEERPSYPQKPAPPTQDSEEVTEAKTQDGDEYHDEDASNESNGKGSSETIC
jgi:Arc/MetJ-type ribon-helix-helix transcriptional regulator